MTIKSIRYYSSWARHNKSTGKSSIKEIPVEEAKAVLEIDAQMKKFGLLQKSTKKCPECDNHFRLVVVDNVEIDVCNFCMGCWFESDELKEIVETNKDVPSDNLKSRSSRYSCPQCEVDMTEHVYKNPDNLLVDKCSNCNGVYLEKGELKRVFKTIED